MTGKRHNGSSPIKQYLQQSARQKSKPASEPGGHYNRERAIMELYPAEHQAVQDGLRRIRNVADLNRVKEFIDSTNDMSNADRAVVAAILYMRFRTSIAKRGSEESRVPARIALACILEMSYTINIETESTPPENIP